MKYKIGQLVKMINSSCGNPDTVGHISGYDILCVNKNGYLCIDPYAVTDLDGRVWACMEHNIVPITPNGQKKSHWDQCLWQPDREEEFNAVFEYVRLGRAP